MIRGRQGLNNRLLAERSIGGEEANARDAKGRPRRTGRSVTVNLAESPLGWLRSRGHVDARQCAAGERLRADWEKAQLGPRVTMRWDAPLLDRGARGAPPAYDPGTAGLSAKARFDGAVAAVGPGLGDVLWRVVCAGEGMREAETALGWPARAGKLVLGLALDRLADFYRLPLCAAEDHS